MTSTFENHNLQCACCESAINVRNLRSLSTSSSSSSPPQCSLLLHPLLFVNTVTLLSATRLTRETSAACRPACCYC